MFLRKRFARKRAKIENNDEAFEFGKLPAPLQQLIFSFINLKYLPIVTHVNKRFYQLAHGPHFWLPKLHLHFPNSEKKFKEIAALDWNKQFQASSPNVVPKPGFADMFRECEYFRRNNIYFRWAYENDTENILKAMFAYRGKNKKTTNKTLLNQIAILLMQHDFPQNTFCSLAARFDNQKLLNAYYEIICTFYRENTREEINRIELYSMEYFYSVESSLFDWAIMSRQPILHLRFLLKEGHRLTPAKNTKGNSSLMLATYHYPAAIPLLLLQGADINECNLYGETALITAASYGINPAINTLVANHAQLVEGALLAAVLNGNLHSVKLLLLVGADPNLPAETPLMIAAKTGNDEIINLLLDHGAAINQVNPDYRYTALLYAIEGGHETTAALLIAKGADIHFIGGCLNQRVLDYAIYHKLTKLSNLLIECGAEPTNLTVNTCSPT